SDRPRIRLGQSGVFWTHDRPAERTRFIGSQGVLVSHYRDCRWRKVDQQTDGLLRSSAGRAFAAARPALMEGNGDCPLTSSTSDEFDVKSRVAVNDHFSKAWTRWIRRCWFGESVRISVAVFADPDTNGERGSALRPDSAGEHILALRVGVCVIVG